jgi:hypothetical protein
MLNDPRVQAAYLGESKNNGPNRLRSSGRSPCQERKLA